MVLIMMVWEYMSFRDIQGALRASSTVGGARAQLTDHLNTSEGLRVAAVEHVSWSGAIHASHSFIQRNTPSSYSIHGLTVVAVYSEEAKIGCVGDRRGVTALMNYWRFCGDQVRGREE